MHAHTFEGHIGQWRHECCNGTAKEQNSAEVVALPHNEGHAQRHAQQEKRPQPTQDFVRKKGERQGGKRWPPQAAKQQHVLKIARRNTRLAPVLLAPLVRYGFVTDGQGFVDGLRPPLESPHGDEKVVHQKIGRHRTEIIRAQGITTAKRADHLAPHDAFQMFEPHFTGNVAVFGARNARVFEAGVGHKGVHHGDLRISKMFGQVKNHLLAQHHAGIGDEKNVIGTGGAALQGQAHQMIDDFRFAAPLFKRKKLLRCAAGHPLRHDLIGAVSRTVGTDDNVVFISGIALPEQGFELGADDFFLVVQGHDDGDEGQV